MSTAKKQTKIIPVILSGGAGTRLWPMSRADRPKQFFSQLDSNHSLMQDTLLRVKDNTLFHPPIVIGNQQHRFQIAEQLQRLNMAASIMLEPCGRNTAPAITAAALYIEEHYGDAAMLVLPTDHVIADEAEFLEKVREALALANAGHLVTFGITPTYAETGYGYILRGKPLENGAYAVASFVEKPDTATAETYVAGGEHFWNSGMFLFPSALLLSEMQRLQPEIVARCRTAVAELNNDLDFMRLESDSFSVAPNISIDYAVMEHTEHAAMLPISCGWSDTGTWDTLWRISPKDAAGNVEIGDSYVVDSRNCYIRNVEGPKIAALGLDDLVVVSTSDAVLIAHKDQAHALKNLTAHIQTRNPDLIAQNCRVYRPWGMYQRVNSGERYQVKHIHVKPGAKLSLQMHYHRAEHWIVVSGTAKVVCGDQEKILTENQSIYIPHGCVHRIENPGKLDLEIIEVQSGAYLDEDDIVRFDDQYGRVENKKNEQSA